MKKGARGIQTDKGAKEKSKMNALSHYNKNLKCFARQNRNSGTLGEALLWKNLLSRSKLGFQFNRQFAFENYILDFICRKLKLVIEVDGSSHDTKQDADALRDAKLNSLGYEVLRITENDVRHNFENVTRVIVCKVEELKLKYSL